MVTKERRAREARDMLRSAEAVSHYADLACEAGGEGVTTEKYQACVREQAIHSARLASQSAELLQQMAMARAYGGGKLTDMWLRIHAQACCLAASTGAAIVEEEATARRENSAKN
jgi:hypothetical protein